MNTNVFITYAVAEIKALKTKRYEAVKKTNKTRHMRWQTATKIQIIYNIKT